MAKSTQTKIMEQVNIIQNAYNEIKLLGGSMWVKSPDNRFHRAGQLHRGYGTKTISALEVKDYDFIFDTGE